MKRGFLTPVLALLAMAVFAASAQAVPHSSAQGLSHRNACGVAGADSARCFAKVVTNGNGSTFNAQPDVTGGPAGWGATDLRSAYNLTTDSTATVAIVDAYDDPNAERDLGVYRQQYGLDPCTTSNGCFKKINQSGTTSPLPAADKGWAEEISLDLDMVSAACPHCNILLVEATTNSFANLGAAVDQASGQPGVVAISNSYGGNEFSLETSSSYDGHYNHPGQAVTVSSGDSGYGAEFPAASKYVTAVGGTSLSKSSTGRLWTETAWSGAGSGCSAYEPKPSWQHDAACARRTVADVSAVADPNTGVAVNDTYGGDPGWMVFGGTSASSPLIATVFAMAGTTDPSLPYGHTGSLNDVTSGSNGRCTVGRKGNSGSAYLCTAVPGYDGPTGLGTPNGLGAF